MAVGDPFNELVGTGADNLRLPCRLALHSFPGHDRQLGDGVGQGREEGSCRLGKSKLHGVVVDDLDFFQVGQFSLAGGYLQEADHRGPNILGFHFLAVVERNPFAQVEGVNQPIGGDVPRFGQHGDDSKILIEGN